MQVKKTKNNNNKIKYIKYINIRENNESATFLHSFTSWVKFYSLLYYQNKREQGSCCGAHGQKSEGMACSGHNPHSWLALHQTHGIYVACHAPNLLG